jgi:hypothetical protein
MIQVGSGPLELSIVSYAWIEARKALRVFRQPAKILPIKAKKSGINA